MKTGIWMSVVAYCFLVQGAQAGQVTIWEDGFESEDFSRWSSVSGGWKIVTDEAGAQSGNRRAQVSGGEIEILTKEISTVGYLEPIVFEFYWKVNSGLEVNDHVYAQWTEDGGGHYGNLTDFAGSLVGDWQLASFVLPVDAANNPQFGVRFISFVDSGTQEIFSIDSVRLYGVPEPASLSLLLLASLVLLRVRRRQ